MGLYIARVFTLCLLLNVTVNITANTKWQEFKEYTGVLGLELLGIRETVTSWDKCAFRCMAKYRSCYSFIYNSYTGLCSPGKKPSSSEKLFSSGYACDQFPYKMVKIRDVVSCLFVSAATEKYNYHDAKSNCTAMSGQLYTIKVEEKMEMLRQYLTNNTRIWIGLDDLEETDKFVWIDGTPMTAKQRELFFRTGEPDAIGSEHYVRLYEDGFLANVFSQRRGAWACEVPALV